MKRNLMRSSALALAAFVVAALAAHPALARGTCIRGFDIQSSDRPNDNSIVFTMKNGSVYTVNTIGRCPGLAADPEGFTFSPTDPGSDEYCDNLVTIKLNTSQSTCLLGAFVKTK